MGTRRRIAFGLAVMTPLLVVAMIGYSALTAAGGSELRVAKGLSEGVFHPVAGAFEPDDTVVADCDDHDCLQQAFGNIAYYDGPKAAFDAVETQLAPRGTIQADCHRIVHFIGSASLARYDLNVAKAFAEGDSLCASGYYHGILERAFAGVKAKGALGEVARALCTGTGIRRRSYLDSQCRHGLGHGLMIQTGYDLPLASSICGNLQTGWDEVQCLGGVFMENATTRFGFRSRWLDDEDPLYPCAVIAPRARSSCYSRAPYRVIELNGRDFGEAAALCGGIGQRWQTACFRGLGREVYGEATPDHARIVALCRLAQGRQSDCMNGAARAIADGAETGNLRRASKLCRHARGDVRTGCLRGMGSVVGLLWPTDKSRRSTCARWSGGDVDECVRGARDAVDPTAARYWS